MGAFTKYGFSVTTKGRFTVVLAEGPLAECVRIRVQGNLMWIEPHKNGIYGSKYNNANTPDAWSYQITKSGLGESWSHLIDRYPDGVAMMELEEPFKLTNGSLRFHLPTHVRPVVNKDNGGPRRVKGHNGRKHRGSNGNPVVHKAPEIPRTEVLARQEDDKPFLLPSKTIGYPEEGLDIPTAISFLNAVKRGFGDCFEMTVKPNGELRAAIFEEFE